MFWIIGGDAICRSLPAVTDAPWARFLAGQVEHKPWAGFTFYDLIFPLFLFIIGAVFPFSLLKRAETGKDRKRVYLHVVKRTLILILLGLIAGGVLRIRLRQHALDGRPPADRDLLSPRRHPGAQHQGQDAGRRLRRASCSFIGRRWRSSPFPATARGS